MRYSEFIRLAPQSPAIVGTKMARLYRHIVGTSSALPVVPPSASWWAANMIVYLVVNENTLAYVDDESKSPFVGVLAGSVIRGGHDWKNGPICIGRLDFVRLATREDFDTYRVQAPKPLDVKRERPLQENSAARPSEDLEAATPFSAASSPRHPCPLTGSLHTAAGSVVSKTVRQPVRRFRS